MTHIRKQDHLLYITREQPTNQPTNQTTPSFWDGRITENESLKSEARKETIGREAGQREEEVTTRQSRPKAEREREEERERKERRDIMMLVHQQQSISTVLTLHLVRPRTTGVRVS